MKTSVADLAILGGPALFHQKLYVGCPNIGDRERLFERFDDILDRRWLSNNGFYVQQFEQCIADLLGVKHCIVTCNGTAALEIAIRALGMQGEVIVPSMTFIATAHALQWQQITPVFCDIDPHTCNLDPRRVEALITPQTSGIIGVHLWGRPCDTEALADVARRHHLKLCYDAAHAFYCSHEGLMIGNFGDAEVFSFHATKFLNSVEGGAVTTNDDALAARLRSMRNFGFAEAGQVAVVGTNGKMNEMSAAMGLTSLESLKDIIEVNQRNYHLYREALQDIPGVELIAYDETERGNYQYIIIKLDPVVTGLSRDQWLAILAAENVMARPYFHPGCHEMEPYASRTTPAQPVLAETEKLSRRVLALPTGTAVEPEAIHRICDLMRLVVQQGPGINQWLRERAGAVEAGDHA